MPTGPTPRRLKNPAERIEEAAIVFDLKLAGHSYRQIDHLTRDPNGPTRGKRISDSQAKDLVREEARRRIDPRVESLRAIEGERLAASLVRLEASLARLDGLTAAAMAVLEREHITVNNGHIIRIDGEPLPDDGPVLQAIAQLTRIEGERRANETVRMRISESLRNLFGLNAPVRTEIQVTEVTREDIALQEMVAELKAKNANTEQELRAGRERPE